MNKLIEEGLEFLNLKNGRIEIRFFSQSCFPIYKVSFLDENKSIAVKIYEKDFPEIKEVDHKIVMLAKEVKGSVITTDFNLNKVASLQGVRVLNINDLSNALKPIVLPGETMTIFVAKEGKEKEQGVGYLDDGTLVIIEEAKRLTGKKVEVLVSSVLQTSSGRMIFTKLKEKPNHHSHQHR
jgi:uncharacterized protein YacL